MSIKISEEAGVRNLHFDTPWIQGSMRIARPDSLELEYTRQMMWPLLMHPEPWPKRVLMIGLGAGSMLKFLLRYRPESLVTVVEIDPEIPLVAQQFFKVPAPGDRYTLFIDDGLAWLQQHKTLFDLILVDGFDRHAKPHHLESQNFYALCKSHLAPRGILSCNLLTLHRQHRSTRKYLAEIFDRGITYLPVTRDGNVVALAQKTPWKFPDRNELLSQAEALKENTRLNLKPVIDQLEDL